mmetsp:Transcript_469/g.700  ORF Transcript_469/g.700 Transcript_469/m.700 type:complete len:84 (+) Transcript_469:71-322(+)
MVHATDRQFHDRLGLSSFNILKKVLNLLLLLLLWNTEKKIHQYSIPLVETSFVQWVHTQSNSGERILQLFQSHNDTLSHDEDT